MNGDGRSFFTPEFFTPGFFADEFFADELAERRPRRNVRFIPNQGAVANIRGVEAIFKAGGLAACGAAVAYKPRYLPLRASVGSLCGYAGAQVQLRGVSARTKLRAPSPSAASAVRMAGVRAIARCGTVAPSGGAIARAQWMEESEVFVGDLKAAGIQNPTDEELALVALLLTRNNTSRTMRSNH